jgi:hypothetical protein
MLCTDTPSVHLVLKDFSPKPYCLHLQDRWMNRCSTVGSSGAKAPVLAHPCLDSHWASNRPTVSHIDRQMIRCYYLLQLFFFQSSDVSTKWTVGSSDGANFNFCLLRSVPSTPTLASSVPSVHPTMSFLFLSFLVLTLEFGMWYFCIHGPRNVYKDMLSNMVSHIDHVMNHQNHTRTNGIWCHVRYTITPVVTRSVVLLQFCDMRLVSFILGANCNVHPLIFYVVYSPMVHKNEKN